MPKLTISRQPLGRRWPFALLVAILAGPALAQTPGTPPSEAAAPAPLSAEVAAAGQPARQLAANLRGDVVLLLRDEVQGSSHQAILVWMLRSPGALLGLTDGTRQLDQQSVDCAAATRTVWRSEAYRAHDADNAPARGQPIAPEKRRSESFAELSGTVPLMAAALRTLCAGGGTVVKAPVTPANEEKGAMAGAVASGVASELLKPSAASPPAPPFGGRPAPMRTDPGAIDQPLFPDTVLSVRALARLTESTYASPTRRDDEAAALRVLTGVMHQLNQRSESDAPPQQREHQRFKLVVVQMALDESRRKLAQFQKQIDDRQGLLAELQLVQQELPAVSRKPPDTFKAELYRHTPTGQHLLAFRGTAEAADWISNAWLGVDLMAATSPHYLAADNLVTALMRKGIQPITLGHSLGGGMAQYTAYRHDLRVVGFNASPVPERYLSGNRYDPARARLFTALELPRQTSDPIGDRDARIGDPLSLQVARLRKLSPVLHNWIKASHQLVKPICLLTRPEPYFEPEEDADLADAVAMNFIQGPLQTLIHLTPGETSRKVALAVAANQGIDFLMLDPAWREVAGSDTRAGAEAQKRAVKAGVKQVKALAAMGKAMFTLANVARGANMGRTAVDVTAGMIDLITVASIKRMLQVHGMARFVRGLGATGDLNPYDVQPDGSTPCAQIQSTL